MTQQDHQPQQPLDELQALIDAATPGPWHYGDEDERIVGGECVDIHAGEYCTESYRSVASAEGPFDGADFGPLDDESRANARLIALAPQLAAENISLHQEIQRLREERDFLLARSKAAGSCSFSLERWTGMSSNALVEVAFGEPNGCLPMDGQDLAACYRTVTRMPKHLRTDAVFDQLEQGEREVSESNLTWAREVTRWPGRAALSQENSDDR